MRRSAFPLQDLNDGWAIMAYDALAAVATALRQPMAVPSQLQAALSDDQLRIPGADGPFSFDASGNRAGPGPVLVRLCLAAGGGDQVTTVAVQPGKPASC